MRSRRKLYRSKSKQGQQAASWQIYAIGVATVLGVAILGVLLVLNLRGTSPQHLIEDLVQFSRMERSHTEEEVIAGDLPPAGGIHNPTWQTCGIYDEPIAVENALHSLEHGAVWVTYQPDLPEASVAALRNQSRGERSILLSPYPGLRSAVVMTAWEVQLELDSVEDGRIMEFIDQYRNGPTAPEPGASCLDGVGTPNQ